MAVGVGVVVSAFRLKGGECDPLLSTGAFFHSVRLWTYGEISRPTVEG